MSLLSAGPGGAAHLTLSPPEIESTSARPESRSGTRVMEEAEVDAFLDAHDWGVLSTIGAGGPYAVPVSYGYDGQRIYVAMGPGRKLNNLQENPALCLTVVDVRTASSWQSVVVVGRAERLSGVRERLQALDALHGHRSPGEISASDLARLAKAKLLRIQVEEITGRSCG